MPSKFDPQKHHRRSIRLQGYDYAQSGAYYVTIVAWHRERLFGEVVNGEMRLNKFGLVATIIRSYKSAVAYRINLMRRTQGIPVWQRNYWEHIIRNQQDLQNKTDYIEANPMLWDEDDENPSNVKP